MRRLGYHLHHGHESQSRCRVSVVQHTLVMRGQRQRRTLPAREPTTPRSTTALPALSLAPPAATAAAAAPSDVFAAVLLPPVMAPKSSFTLLFASAFCRQSVSSPVLAHARADEKSAE